MASSREPGNPPKFRSVRPWIFLQFFSQHLTHYSMKTPRGEFRRPDPPNLKMSPRFLTLAVCYSLPYQHTHIHASPSLIPRRPSQIPRVLLAHILNSPRSIRHPLLHPNALTLTPSAFSLPHALTPTHLYLSRSILLPTSTTGLSPWVPGPLSLCCAASVSRCRRARSSDARLVML